ncbi:MAG: Holliday junction resolvase RuvX [Candidatus Eremiobacteraeota bacterium]|nr:Holliday junction resolvase RuvX [Candidatus Eremiobacteraeota bacterium]
MPIFALDVGTRRIGIAVADPSGSFAMPVRVLERTNVRDDISEIVALLRSYAADEIVVGDPVTLAGARGIASKGIDRFVQHLARAFSGTIHRLDERMTTAQAQKTLIAADVSRKKRKGVVDQMAAALILESFLARRRNGTL